MESPLNLLNYLLEENENQKNVEEVKKLKLENMSLKSKIQIYCIATKH